MLSFIIAIILLWVAPLNAEVTWKDYKQVKNEGWFKQYVDGVGTGYSWANNYLVLKGQHPLYCQPDKLSLNARNYWEILDKYISQKNKMESYPLEIPIEPLLLYSLRETFPRE